jgi:hypothetical protein
VGCSLYASNSGLRDGYGPFFLGRLYSVSARHGEGDRLVWTPSKKCLFEVRSFYEELLRKDFFLISKNSLKNAEGRNPSTQEVYKGAPKKRTETNKKVKNQRTAYYPSYAPTPKDITY